MAKTNNDEPPVEATRPPVNKKKRIIGIGSAAGGLLLLAYIAVTLAVPSKPTYRTFDGPFTLPISKDRIEVNLAGESNKRFLVMHLQAVYDAYEQRYLEQRMQDPLYQPLLVDALLAVSSAKTREEVYGPVGQDAFREELRRALDPILFPVHVGNARTPHQSDGPSGLRPGLSADRSSLRGPLLDHQLFVDAELGRIRLDEGPERGFTPGDRDVRVENERGHFVFVDTGGLKSSFRGSVHVGVHGRVRQLLFLEFLVQ